MLSNQIVVVISSSPDRSSLFEAEPVLALRILDVRARFDHQSLPKRQRDTECWYTRYSGKGISNPGVYWAQKC